ncbi:MAG: protein-disulfide isomerase-like protein [Alphaproteobacteria bacterium]|nr:protein-disulfide isomerase-like protein [Alphaproteobacteria bacterium]MDB5720555.1 protein-disulfide isomerase-like protein [Alphaproteobacteria bacterium]
MKSLFGTSALALALVLGGCGKGGDAGNNQSASAAPLAQVAAPNGDWTQTIAETPEGGVRMGNPDAKVKLVEYASITCPHCAEFTEKAADPLTRKYVKSGQVSWEYRPFMLFPSDAGIFLLLRCQGPNPFFQSAEQLYADQPNWVGKIQALSEAQQQQLQNMNPAQRSAVLVRASGVDQFFRQRGMPESRIESCLSDQAGLQKLVDITDRASNKEGVTGTPTFFLNGKVVEGAAAWEALEPALRSAVG